MVPVLPAGVSGRTFPAESPKPGFGCCRLVEVIVVVEPRFLQPTPSRNEGKTKERGGCDSASAKEGFHIIGSPTEVDYLPFSAPRESVLSYYSTSGSRSLTRHVSRSWGLASLMQALKETSEAITSRMRLAYQGRSSAEAWPERKI